MSSIIRHFRVPAVLSLGLAAVIPAAQAANPMTLGHWIEVETEDLTVLSNATRAETLEVIDRLHRLRLVFLQLTGDPTFRPPLPTTLYIFKDDWAFKPFKRGDGPPTLVAGYLLATPDAHILAMNLKTGQQTANHELVHSLFRFRRPGLPLAIEEGLAEYYGAFVSKRKWAEVGRPMVHHALGLSRALMVPIPQLLGIYHESLDHASSGFKETQSQRSFYAQSWALVHLLLSGEGGRGQMERFLARLSAGEEPVEALLASYQTDIATLEIELDRYLRAGEFQYIQYRFRDKPEPPAATIRKLERGEALLRLADLLAHRPPIRFQAAREYVHDSLKTAPEEPLAYVILGWLAQTEGNEGEALRLYERARSIDPDHPRALSLQGRLLLHRAGETEAEAAARSADVAAARALLRRSLERRPGHPPTLAALGGTYLLSGNAADGIGPLSQAVQKLPGRLDFLVDLILLTARSGNLAGARALVQHALSARPRGGTLVTATLAEIDRIEGQSGIQAPPRDIPR